MTKPRYCILLVDDSLDDRAVCRRRLGRDTRSEYEIHEVESGSAGLTACATVQPDCIVLDYRLPDLDGLQFLTRVQEQFGVQAPAVVMLTGTGHEAIVVEAMKRGAQDYVRKGAFTTETLSRAIANAIEKVTLQRQVVESAARLRLFVAQAPVAIAMCDRQMCYLAVSDRWRAEYGLGVADLIGRCHYDLFPELPGAWRAVHERALAGAVERQDEDRFVRQDGVVQWIRWEVQPWRQPDGAIGGLMIFSEDITARKQADAERERLIAELQRINAEFQQFSYIVSHDLGEPLRTMRNYVQLLARQMQGQLAGEAEEYMAFVTDAAQRMQQMLTDLLAYTQAGQTPELGVVDCEAVLAQVLQALQARIRECGAIITHDLLPTVQGDATRLGQVLQNLVGNALKFCEAKPPRVHLSAVKEDSHWQFSVRDNGIGIDPQQIGRLFQVFQRLHTRSEYPGSGIGLAICKRIVEQHGGRIWVESTPGEGTTFFFTLAPEGGRHGQATLARSDH